MTTQRQARQRGQVLMEYAITLPMLILMVVGLIDTAQLVLLNSQIDHVVREAGNLVSRGDQVDEAWSTLLAGHTTLDLNGRGQLIFTTINKCPTDTNPCVSAQVTRGARSHIASAVGAVGGVATLPRPVTMRDGETITVVEAAYDFIPLVNAPSILGFSYPTFVRRASYF